MAILTPPDLPCCHVRAVCRVKDGDVGKEGADHMNDSGGHTTTPALFPAVSAAALSSKDRKNL